MQNTYQEKILDLENTNNSINKKLEGGIKFKIKSNFQEFLKFQNKLQIPSSDILFIQRKIGGLFLLGKLLKVEIDLNKILIAIELLHSSFNWTEDEYNELNSWMKNRALELFPADRTGKGIRTYCPTKILSYKDKREACKNKEEYL